MSMILSIGIIVVSFILCLLISTAIDKPGKRY